MSIPAGLTMGIITFTDMKIVSALVPQMKLHSRAGLR